MSTEITERTEVFPAKDITEKIIGACIEVHKEMGPGLLESAYEECLCHELGLQNISFERQKSVPVLYKGVRLDPAFRLDVFVENSVVVEIKSVENILDVHEAQLLTYLKLTKMRVGLLINFNVPLLKTGIKRFVF